MLTVAKYVGLKYQSRGRDWSGVDCYGLVKLFYRQELGVELPDYNYSDADNMQEVSLCAVAGRSNPNLWTRVLTAAWGDVVMFRIAGLPAHIGVVLNNRDFLHAFHGRNACVESLESINWRQRIDGYFRWNTSH